MTSASDSPGPAVREDTEVTRLGDFTTRPRVLLIAALAIVVGTGGVAAGWVLLRLITLVNNLAYYGRITLAPLAPGGHGLGWLAVLVPVVGAVLIGLMARYGSDKIRGHGIPEAMEAILIGRSRLSLKVAILKPLSSAIAIGTGGPFGAEGPIIMTGGAIGSLLAQLFPVTDQERKTLLVAGASAGMTAVFGTPIAAILLAVELLLFEWKPRSFIPVAVACITATIERHVVMTPAPLFPFVGTIAVSWTACLGWVGLGVASGLGSGLLTTCVYGAEDAFKKLPIHWMWWPVLGGAVVGIGGLIDPAALGVGYINIAHLISGQMNGASALRLLAVKAVIWAVALGSGTSGGVLAPLLIMGGALGALAAHVLPAASPGFWALVGMAAIMGGTMRAPLTASLFAVELTGNHDILLPVITACTASFAVTVLLLKRSILTEKVARRGYHLSREYHVDALALAHAAEVMAAPVDTLPAGMSVAEAIRFFESPEAHHRHYPVIDAAERVVGLVSRVDILRWEREPPMEGVSLAKALAGRAVPVAHPDSFAAGIVDQMLATGAARVPIVTRAEGRLVGIVARSDLLAVRARMHREETERVGWLSLRRARAAKGTPAVVVARAAGE